MHTLHEEATKALKKANKELEAKIEVVFTDLHPKVCNIVSYMSKCHLGKEKMFSLDHNDILCWGLKLGEYNSVLCRNQNAEFLIVNVNGDIDVFTVEHINDAGYEMKPTLEYMREVMPKEYDAVIEYEDSLMGTLMRLMDDDTCYDEESMKDTELVSVELTNKPYFSINKPLESEEVVELDVTFKNVKHTSYNLVAEIASLIAFEGIITSITEDMEEYL